jgi:3-carboxy-cis,cis-muconate cycloisomerase
MAVSPFDSAIYRELFRDEEVGRLFTDSAEVRAMMLVEGALAKVQGRIGVIPAVSGDFLDRAMREIQVDPESLARETGVSAVPVPALLAALRKALQAPEHAQYLHWGATSQDVIDTALVLRLRQVLAIAEARIVTLVKALGQVAALHESLPMVARTYGQAATPTSFGAVVASWGVPFLRHLQRLEELRPRLLVVSLGGAAGTLSAMGPKGPECRAALARELALADPGGSWHAERDRVAELAGWLGLVLGSLGKFGEDLLLLTQAGIGEVRLTQGGGSSTMPQKVNPVLPSLMVALARHGQGLVAALQGAALHRQNRDGSAWFVEWLALPDLAMSTARALSAAGTCVATLEPVPGRMAELLEDSGGLIHAEALAFALSARMPRPEAQAAVKVLCEAVRAGGGTLSGLAAQRWPDLHFDFGTGLGTAPEEARAFASAAAALRRGGG